MSKADLYLDWAKYQAARYACERWHYAGCIPRGKNAFLGVWERAEFVGVVSFGRGTSPFIGEPYGLGQEEVVELNRVALTRHVAPVTRIVAVAIRIIKRTFPGVRLVVSLADASQGHVGRIYQGGNWVYVGRSAAVVQYYWRGKWRNDANLRRAMQRDRSLKDKLRSRRIPGKHKYLYPLDEDIERRVRPLGLPYPKADGAR